MDDWSSVTALLVIVAVALVLFGLGVGIVLLTGGARRSRALQEEEAVRRRDREQAAASEAAEQADEEERVARERATTWSQFLERVRAAGVPASEITFVLGPAPKGSYGVTVEAKTTAGTLCRIFLDVTKVPSGRKYEDDNASFLRSRVQDKLLADFSDAKVHGGAKSWREVHRPNRGFEIEVNQLFV